VLLHSDEGPYSYLTSAISTSFALNLMVAVCAKMLKQLQHAMELKSKSCAKPKDKNRRTEI
jgi:hypothetical protein